MERPWRKSFAHMSRGVEARHVVIQALSLALLSALFTSPYFYYLLVNVHPVNGNQTKHIFWEILISQLFLVFIICLISAMVGLVYSKRYELMGLGDPKHLLESLPQLSALGIVLIVVSYFLFDRHFITISPISYPKDAFYLLILPLKEAFTGEIILRLGLVTILVGLLKRKFTAVSIVAVFSALLSIKYNRFAGINIGFEFIFIGQLICSMTIGLISGYLFVTRGLFSAMFFRFILGFRYAFVVWMV